MDRVREISVNICDIVSDFLYDKGIWIPCDDAEEEKERNEDVALYGTEFFDLVDEIETYLRDKGVH